MNMNDPNKQNQMNSGDVIEPIEVVGDLGGEEIVEMIIETATTGIELAGTVAGATLEGLGSLDIGI